jgi:hypothetical protein
MLSISFRCYPIHDNILICLFIYSFIHPSIHSSIHPSIHPSIHSSIHSYLYILDAFGGVIEGTMIKDTLKQSNLNKLILLMCFLLRMNTFPFALHPHQFCATLPQLTIRGFLMSLSISTFRLYWIKNNPSNKTLFTMFNKTLIIRCLRQHVSTLHGGHHQANKAV